MTKSNFNHKYVIPDLIGNPSPVKFMFWIIILFVIFFTRFYKLDSIPPSLTIDEVSIGYNAFSILKTGRDEWGNLLPISFRSVGDFKAPTLIYLTVPFIRIFGLNEFGVRLPVAIFSALNILLFWILVKLFVFNRKFIWSPYIATLIFSLSPWLIPFSRSGFEAVIALTFLLTNLIFAFKFKQSGSLQHFFFMFLFAFLSAITYHSTKIVVPLINLFFIGFEFSYFRSRLKAWSRENKTALIFTSTVFLLLMAFFVGNFILGPGSSRASMTMLSKDFDFSRGLLPQFQQHPFSGLTSSIGLFSLWFKRLLEYFSPNFYLTSGLGLVTPGQPGQGVIYSIEFPFLILGFLLLIFKSNILNTLLASTLATKLLIVWLFISLLPASVTNNSQHALRTLNIVPVITILIVVGFEYTYSFLKKNFLRYLFFTLVLIGYMYGLLRFTDYYSLHYPVELSETRSYGWKQMAIFARGHHTEYDSVYVDPRFGTQGPYTYGVPYLYFLFYSKYDPKTYIDDPRRNSGTDFENYIFEPIERMYVDQEKNNLYIASPWTFPSELISSKNQKYYVPFLNNSSGLYAISDR